MADILVPMSFSDVGNKDSSYVLCAIEGIRYNQSRPDKFISTRPGHTSALVALFDHPVQSERIRLSPAAMLTLETMDYHDFPATWEASLKAGGDVETNQMMQPNLRLDRHVYLSSLFATSRPMQEIEIWDDVMNGAADRRGKDGYILYRDNDITVRNASGRTVLDVLSGMVDWETKSWFVKLPTSKIRFLPFHGLDWSHGEITLFALYQATDSLN